MGRKRRMNNRAHKLSTYRFRKQEKILFDTNVWVYLFPAPSASNRRQTRFYSSALQRMLATPVSLMLDALVLSEYVNTYCRIEWGALYQLKYPKFKDFRQSPEFPRVAKAVTANAHAILKLTTRVDHPFEIVNVDHVLRDLATGRIDFNDGLLVETCRNNGWKLVTHDSDFTSGGIQILTHNRQLLAACQAKR